jgi:predicted AAA+ superfamily ATPase
MYKRLTELPSKQSFFLFGPRGCGKSTLIKNHFKNKDHLWINLLDQKLDLELNNNPDGILEMWSSKKTDWIVIDEVQKIPKLLDVVHRGIEDYKIKFALTGSSARKLKRGRANLLAGRAASLLLSPFSALEIQKEFELTKALKFGLLPQYWSEGLGTKEITRSLYSYVQTYLKEEIAAEQIVRKLDPFRRFLNCAAQSNGKIINYSSLERDAGISHSQAESHFEILCDTLVGRYLEPFDTSVRKRQSKKSKFYFFDTGVVRTLSGQVEESLSESTYEFGTLFETFLINEFFKLKESLEKNWQFSYLRTKDDAEIDLIIEKPRSKPILVEIKSFKSISEKSITSFSKISDAMEYSERYLLSNCVTSYNKNGIRCLHWTSGLKEIFDL